MRSTLHCFGMGVVLFSLAPSTMSFSRGASHTSCQDMIPGHIRAQPQDPRHSYVTLRTSASSYLPGHAVRSSRDFMGFLLQARSVAVAGGKMGGAWTLTPPGTHTLRCLSEGDTLTHSDKQLKRNLSFVWRAPDAPMGDIRFFITVVQSYFVYWADIESAVVEPIQDQTNSVKFETQSSSWSRRLTESQMSLIKDQYGSHSPSPPHNFHLKSFLYPQTSSHKPFFQVQPLPSKPPPQSQTGTSQTFLFSQTAPPKAFPQFKISLPNSTLQSRSPTPRSILQSHTISTLSQAASTQQLLTNTHFLSYYKSLSDITKSQPVNSPSGPKTGPRQTSQPHLQLQTTVPLRSPPQPQRLSSYPQAFPQTITSQTRGFPQTDQTVVHPNPEPHPNLDQNFKLNLGHGLKPNLPNSDTKLKRPSNPSGTPNKEGKYPDIVPRHSAWELGMLLGCSAGLGMVLVVGVRYFYRQSCGKRTEVTLNDREREYERGERGLIHVQECGDLVRVRKIRENSFMLLAEYDILASPNLNYSLPPDIT
uniref:Reeler domain containing 1 n=1 Tax=Scophthalmus maximus TaxID=52904 RepID=A0A8D3AYU9_SCOMX